MTFQKGKNWKDGKIKNTDGYILIYQPNHPFTTINKYIREHRLVMEQELGRYLLPIEVVHHINGIRTDNRIENLQLIDSNSNHIKLEHKLCEYSKGMLGKKHTLQARIKMRKNHTYSWLGRHHTEETKRKMSLAHMHDHD